MASITVQDVHELGSALIDSEARQHLRQFSERIARNFIDASEPEASKAYEDYVTDTVLTWLTDCTDEITVQTLPEWERMNEVGERGDYDNSRGL